MQGRLPFLRARAGHSAEIEEYGGRLPPRKDGGRGAEEPLGIISNGHFGTRRYSLSRRWQIFPRPIFLFSPFSVSPPPVASPFTVSDPPSAVFYPTLSQTTVRSLCSKIIFITRIRIHVRCRPPVLPSRADRRPSKTSRPSGSNRDSHITRRGGEYQRLLCAGDGGALHTWRRRKNFREAPSHLHLGLGKKSTRRPDGAF